MSRASSLRARAAAASVEPAAAVRHAAASFVRAVEGIEAAALAGVRHDAELVRDEARDARSLGETGMLGWAWASEECGRAGLAMAGLANALLEMQSSWWLAVEAAARTGLSPLLGDAARPLAAPSPFEWPVGAWLALGGAWLSAIDHDLEGARP